MMPNHRYTGRLLCFAAALAVAIVADGRVARAQDDDEPEENQNAQAARGMAGVIIEQMPNLEQVDQWVFGRFGGSGGARNKLDSSLTVRIEDLERACGLTEAQKKKLRLAGRGDIKRFFDKVEEMKRKLEQGQRNPNTDIWQEIQPLQVEVNTGLFGDDSIYSKTIKRTLDADQTARFESLVRERTSVRYRATVEWFVVHLDKGLGLSDDQRRRLVELLENETQPPQKFGQGDYWYLMLETASLPEATLKPIFDAPQWRLLKRQFMQARGMEQQLRMNGVIPDHKKAGAKAAMANAPALIPMPMGPNTAAIAKLRAQMAAELRKAAARELKKDR
jgi:hypothetical protein